MTAYQYREPKPPATLMREHIAAMRDYASILQDVLGYDNPIVKRIRSCASSNEAELDRWQKSENTWTAQGMAPEGRGREGGPGSSELPSPVAESDAPKGATQ